MKVSAAPHRVDDLLRFLRRLGHEAEAAEDGVVEVGPSGGVVDPGSVFPLAVSLQLRVWNLVNETDARVVEVTEPLEP